MKKKNLIIVPTFYHMIYSGLFAVPLYGWVRSGNEWTLTRYVEIVSDTGTVEKITVGVKSYKSERGCRIAAGMHENSWYDVK